MMSSEAILKLQPDYFAFPLTTITFVVHPITTGCKLSGSLSRIDSRVASVDGDQGSTT